MGHEDWVTSLAMTSVKEDCLVSSSRDKTCLVWAILRGADGKYGVPYKALKGHSHFVSEVRGKGVDIPVTCHHLLLTRLYVHQVDLSSDGEHALSGSWDGTLRLWQIKTGAVQRFIGHNKDVLSVAFSADNRQIVSG